LKGGVVNSLVSQNQKFPHVPLGVGRWHLGYEEQRCWANCPCIISFQDVQFMWSWSTNITDGQTDRHATARPRFAL